MRRTLTWLVTLPFAAASVVIGHTIAYSVTGTPTGGMHDYLAHAPQIVFILASLAVLGLAADARARRHSPLPLAVLGVGAFVAQEHLERLIHTGHVPFLFASPGDVARYRAPAAAGACDLVRRPPAGRGHRDAARRPRVASRASFSCWPRSFCRWSHRRPRRPSRRAALPSPPEPVLRRPQGRPQLPTQEIPMRTALITAIALVAIAIPVAGTTASAAVKPVVISITAVNGRPVGGIKRPTVKKGQTVRIVVRTNVGTQVHLHGYNIEKNVKKGVPTVIQFVAKVQGRFALELHPMDALLAQLTVKYVIPQLLPHVLAHGIGGVQGPPRSHVALLLGRGLRARRLVHPARGAVEDAAARAARDWARPRRGLRQARARAGADRRPGALGVPVRRHPRRGALRHHRPVRQHRPDLGVRHLLGRDAGAVGAVRQRVAGAQPVAGDRRRVRLGVGARPRPRGSPAGRLPGAASAATRAA